MAFHCVLLAETAFLAKYGPKFRCRMERERRGGTDRGGHGGLLSVSALAIP